MRWLILIVVFAVMYIYLKTDHSIDEVFDSRIHYKIGQIDPRFQLSEQEIIALSQQATRIWEDGTAKSWFVYDPKAGLSLNFIYDERQAETLIRLNQLEQIEQTQQRHAVEQRHLQDQQKQLDDSLLHLQQQQADFQQRLDQYNTMVQQINQNGGATAEQRSGLEQYKQNLQQQQLQLQQAIDTHNFNVEHINQNVDSVNQMHQQVNQHIETYNQRFHGRLFHKGEFDGKRINIYEFESKQDLVLTLAHEFGHALGLAHNQDPKALMYPFLKQQDMMNFKLQPADILMLQQR
ncbi:matrixin family metalloprotease [Acinetobacter ihumii]|uniref:matrixin family metalloprotease n=1 Tax=Acinetobacter ihumii TaxID=2483802 RepID=UPI001030A339|nr:matrixin family metalloprotease [Acinetobacter ihumii]